MQDFAEKQAKLAEIIENRVIRSPKYGTNPTKFTFGLRGDELKCVWSTCMTSSDFDKLLFERHINSNGFTAKEWYDLTCDLYKYL